ncbi:MAG: lamin tail domain-containing protein [Chitinophagales bacterium]|nr:lamin tail domain-containing protein [Chitinophagales bacterium]
MKQALSILFILLTPVCLLSQNRYDIVITEIMADPSPQIGLPNNEWIELKNTSTVSFNLQNWRIGDAGSQSGPMPNFILQPDSMVIVCTGSAVGVLSIFGTTISVTSFPSLDNDGDQLFLKAANGMIIHAVSYNSSWYQNEVKKEGGWTLEMIDTKSPCTGSSNWKASINTNGGTPGKKNSVDALNTDNTAPQLQRAYSTDNTTIVLVFDEPVDSAAGATLTNYSIDGGLSLISTITLAPLFNQVQLKTNTALSTNTVYTIVANNITDCKGNRIGSANKAKVGLPADPVAGDWIINEILFNPRPNGFDYIELYNNSNKILDAAKLYIANRNSSGAVSSIKVLSTIPHFIFPGDHMVVTEDAGNLALNYLVENPGNVLVIASLPSFPDDEGTVVALNFQGEVADEVKYKDDWHFKLIDNAEGVSLERIDPAASSQEAANWHSAASTAGFGTPTYKNSQYRRTEPINAVIDILPKVFSPDNDGRDDIAIIQYQITEPGYMANITIFDAAGRPVRNLVRNGVMGLSGYWNWDGLDDKGLKLPVGTYVVLADFFNLQGKKNVYKKTIVLARKLN